MAQWAYNDTNKDDVDFNMKEYRLHSYIAFDRQLNT